MAFSLRKMLSNINYFAKPGDVDYVEPKSSQKADERPNSNDFERTEPDSTSKQASNIKLPESLKNFAAKKSSSSDNEILNAPETPPKKTKRKSKKLKLDVETKAETENLDNSDDTPSENTPKHMLLEARSAEIFKGFDFNKSFDFGLSDEQDTDNADIRSLSEHSDSEGSLTSREMVKMCRKVQSVEENMVRSTSIESFGDVEMDRNEDERLALLFNYEAKLEEMECFVKKLLTEFQFNIEVSKIFHSRVVTEEKRSQKAVNASESHTPSPWDPWNLIVQKEDTATKHKFKKQLISLKNNIDKFVKSYLNDSKQRKFAKQMRDKKRTKHFDFPDLREAMVNLFTAEEDQVDLDVSGSKCACRCHYQSDTDSGVTMKSEDRSFESQSISSSIGNFSLDCSTLTAYSESLELITSYNSFEDDTLYSTLLQKPAIERITFYVQVHSIQLKCDLTEHECDCRSVMTFFCPTCKITETEEDSLLKHILSQKHCEKIHFQYKTAYIKKCVAEGKEIQPSTVLNPMTYYRDANKVVCFGDAVYACSLCFENLIIGESVLMAHCSEQEHLDRKEKLDEIVE